MDAKRLVAHRGDNTNYPENSYAGIEAALLAGARYVEFDVQMNADKSLVVFHDTDFKRTSNKNASLFETTDVQLKTISAHEPKRFGKRHYPTHISHLNEILELLKRYPKAQAFVEIKVESLKHWGLTKVMDALLEALKKYQTQTTIISFSEEALRYTQQHSDLHTGFVFLKYNHQSKQIAESLQPDFLICAFQIIPDNNLWKGNWKWMVYSINDIEKMKQALTRNDINLFETDNIRLMLNT